MSNNLNGGKAQRRQMLYVSSLWQNGADRRLIRRQHYLRGVQTTISRPKQCMSLRQIGATERISDVEQADATLDLRTTSKLPDRTGCLKASIAHFLRLRVEWECHIRHMGRKTNLGLTLIR